MKLNTSNLSRIGESLTLSLTMLAALPYQLGDLATVIPPEWKSTIVLIGLIANFLLRTLSVATTPKK